MSLDFGEPVGFARVHMNRCGRLVLAAAVGSRQAEGTPVALRR